MKISGSILQDYKFQIERGDQGFINDRFIDSETEFGMQTLSVYSSIPKFMVQGAEFSPNEFITAVSPKTLAPLTKTQFLLAHNLCVNVDSGEIASIQSMIAPQWKSISGSNGIIYANHIPSVFSTYKEGVLSSVFGDWNPATNTFTGNVQFITQLELEAAKNAVITG